MTPLNLAELRAKAEKATPGQPQLEALNSAGAWLDMVWRGEYNDADRTSLALLLDRYATQRQQEAASTILRLVAALEEMRDEMDHGDDLLARHGIVLR